MNPGAARPGAFALALALCLAARLALAGATLKPVDEAPTNPEFLAFRTALVAALERHDADAVLAVVDSNIKIGFGGEDGIAAFERMWRPREEDSRLWKELGAVLALGGTFNGEGAFVAPYAFTRWPESIDAFEHVLVTGSRVAARARPSLKGALLGRLSYAIVARASDSEAAKHPDWTRVRLGDGPTAYVASRYVRSPIDYRAFFERKAGRWRMTLFVAGD